MPDIRFQFTVSMNTNGSASVDPNVPEGKETEIEREANIFDIIDASRKLVSDLERQLIIERIEQMLAALAPKPVVTPADMVKDALKERGIDPTDTA